MSEFQIAFRMSCRIIDDLETRLFNASWERMVMAAALQATAEKDTDHA